MNVDRPTLTFLHSFPDHAKREGEALQKAGCVKQIFGNHLFVQGRVEDGGETYRTSLRLEGEEWVPSCSSDRGGRSSAAYATMLERVARDGKLPEAPNEVGEQVLADVLEEKLERELNAEEGDYLDKLEKRYRRFEMEQEIFDHDLVRLNRRWPTESYDPLQLWNEPPGDIVEFWNYIAYAFEKRNLTYPKFLQNITDTGATRDKIQAWEKQRELDEWRARISDVTDEPPPAAPQNLVLRLMVMPNEARLQIGHPGTGDEKTVFQNLAGEDELRELAERHTKGAVKFDGASDLLWMRLSERLLTSGLTSLRLDDVESCQILASLFEQETLVDRLITLDENVFQRVAQPLQWVCAGPEVSSTGDAYVLQLSTAEGEPITHSLRVLPSVRSWFLSDEVAFRGPVRWVEDSTQVDPVYEIPAVVSETDEGVAFFSSLGAGLPPVLEKKTLQVRSDVSMAMHLARGLTGVESEHLVVEIGAADAGGYRIEKLTKGGWETGESKSLPEGKFIMVDRQNLHGIPGKLEPMGLVYDIGIEAFKTRATKAFPEKFTTWLTSLPEDIKIELEGDLETLLSDPVRAKVRFEIKEGDGIDWFDLKIVLDVEGLDLTQKELKSLVAARGGFVRMDDGSWLRLEFDMDEGQRAAVDRLGLDIFDLSGEAHRMHVLQLADAAAKEVFDAEAWAHICKRASALKLRVQPPVPEGLNVTLRNYQVEGFHFLSYLATNRFGGILADDMGLGKTVQSLTWLTWLREQCEGKKIPPILVVCPKSVLDVWAGECVKFAPDLKVQVLRKKDELEVEKLGKEIDVLVLNYSQLRVNGDHLKGVRWLAAVLDEGQQIKNPDSKAAKAARELEADNRLVLTGTPIENRLLDVWSLMAFAMPGVLGNRKYFRDRFDRRKDIGAQTRLSARLRPFLLRRTKGEVAMDLPPRTEEEVYCEMEQVQAELYQAELKRIQDILLGVKNDDALRKNSFVILQGLMRLRQICCHPALIDPSHADAESAKLTALFYTLDQLREAGHKVLVFSQFVTMLDIIRDRLEDEGRPYEYLSGKTKNRNEVVQNFQTKDDPSVFLLSLKAGGSGLNLTAASYVVLYDPWWNPAVENQAIDRAHRIGQTSKVIAYRLLMRDSVEEKIRILQNQKQSLVTGVLGQESFTQNLTRDDLSFLFEADIEQG